MDNEFKGIFRFLSIVLFLSLIWAGLTKAGLIPNWFEIEALCPNSKISLSVDSNDDDIDVYPTMGPDVYYILKSGPDADSSKVDTISTGDVDGENIVNVVTGSVDEVKGLNLEDDFFIIDVNDLNYPQGCNTPGLPNPEKCILRTSNNYCIAPYQTESTQTRYEANKYCNSLNVLGLSRELPYAYQHENNIYWMNLINIKSKIYRFNADGSEKLGHYRAYPVNPTFENCTLRGNCGNEYGSYKLSVRCAAPCEMISSVVKNIDNDELINWSDKMLYWDSYEDDPELSIVMKAMGLRSTACSRIFCQSVADDGTYKNQKHYYWDIKDKKMTLIPDVYYVGRNDCTYYAEIYDKNWIEKNKNVSKNETNA